MSRLTLNSTLLDRSNSCFFSETFESNTAIDKNSGKRTGSWTAANGVTWSTTGNYIDYPNEQGKGNPQLTVYAEFINPNPVGGTNLQVIFEAFSTTDIGYLYLATNGNIFCSLSGVTANITYATYAPYYNFTGVNRLTMAFQSGSSVAYLNGTQIYSSAGAYSGAAAIGHTLRVGINRTASAAYQFIGTINKLQLFNKRMTNEMAQLYSLGTQETRIIDSLIAAGNVVFYHDYRGGDARDYGLLGQTGTLTSGVNFNRNGYRFAANTDYIGIPSISLTDINAGTFIAVHTTPTTQVATNAIYCKRDGVLQQIYINMASAGGGVLTNFNLASKGGAGLVATIPTDTQTQRKRISSISFNLGVGATAYFNGVKVAMAGTSVALDAFNVIASRVGNNGTNSARFNGKLYATMLINRQLTDLEHIQLYNELHNLVV